MLLYKNVKKNNKENDIMAFTTNFLIHCSFIEYYGNQKN